MKRAVVLVSLSLSVVTLNAAGQKMQHDLHWTAPASATTRPNPLAGNAEAVKGGKKLFKRYCSSCHGPKGFGLGRAANLQSVDVQIESDGVLFWKITNGDLDYGMPSFSGLPQLERWQIVLYLHKLGQDLR